MTDILCPNCFRMNPEGSKTCQYCSTSLQQDASPNSSEAGTPPVSQNDEGGDTDLPEWLLSWGDEKEDAAQSSSVSSQAEPTKGFNAGQEESEAQPNPANQEPDWLARIRERSRLDKENEPDALDDLPAWLINDDQPGGPVENSNIEEWSQGLNTFSQDNGLSTGEGENQSLEDQSELPDWLKDATGTSANEDLTESANPLVEPESQPDWLAELSMDEHELAQDNQGQAVNESRDSLVSVEPENIDTSQEIEAPEEAEKLPDWLASLHTEDESPEPALKDTQPPVFTEDTSTVSEYDQVQPFSAEALPDWLARMSSPEENLMEEGQDSSSGKEGNDEITLAPAELPSWVKAMRPIKSATSETPPVITSDEKVEKVGPLAGLRGVLQPERLAPDMRKPPVYSINLQVSEKQRINSALFETILSTERQAQTPPHARPLSSQKVIRLVIALILILAAFIPVWQNSRLLSLPGAVPVEVDRMQSAIASLAPGSTVLLAVDFEPAFSGEINAVATSVISQLMAGSTNLILVSTNPTGPVLGEQLLKEAQMSQPAYSLASNTINLGYLAGGSSGLFTFALEPRRITPLTIDQTWAWDETLLQNVQTLADFASVIVITDNANSARTWVEQVGPSLGNTPLFMVTSAQAAPLIQPYYSAGQVQGYVSGLTGGAIYEQAMAVDGKSSAYWDAYQAGILIAIALIAVGGLIALGSIAFTRRKIRVEE